MKNIYILSNKDIKGAKKLPVIEQIFFKKEIDFKNYDYLIFTSRNGVKAAQNISTKWKELPSLVIGKGTEEEVVKLGGKVLYVAKKSYGDDFAKEIVKNFDKKRFLYLRGKKVLSNLTDILKDSGFDITEEIVYKTVCIKYKNPKNIEKGSFVIFSSPSTVECFFKNFKWDKSYKAIAIGKKTATFIPSNIDYKISPVQSLSGIVKYIQINF